MPNPVTNLTANGSSAAYLRTAVQKTEGASAADENTRVYMILSQLFPNERGGYLSEAVKWQGVHLHREHLRRLPDMVRQGQFFLIFQDHFRWMEFWGLRTELAREDLPIRLNVTPDKNDASGSVEGGGRHCTGGDHQTRKAARGIGGVFDHRVASVPRTCES